MQKEKVESWIKTISLLISAVAILISILTWRRQVHLQSADIFEKKIVEFQDSLALIAKRILDGYGVCGDCSTSTTPLSDRELISIGSSRNGHTEDITLENLGKALNANLPDTNLNYQQIRQSFDYLLDFFGKLDYYLTSNLMSEKEIAYFKHYYEKCASDSAIMEYATTYSFSSFLSLANHLNLR